jgi:hypothetical protein
MGLNPGWFGNDYKIEYDNVNKNAAGDQGRSKVVWHGER